jgi:hypothetical protein
MKQPGPPAQRVTRSDEMGNLSIIESVRARIGFVAFNLFLWANRTTAEKYWSEVCDIENLHRKMNP